jgi:hypothetical protein
MPTQHTPGPIPRLNHTPRIRSHPFDPSTHRNSTRHFQPRRSTPGLAMSIRRVFSNLPRLRSHRQHSAHPNRSDPTGLPESPPNRHRRAYSPRICPSRQASTPPFRTDSPPLYSAAPPNATTHVPSNQSDIPCPPVTSRIRQPLSPPLVPNDHPATRRNSVYSCIQ